MDILLLLSISLKTRERERSFMMLQNYQHVVKNLNPLSLKERGAS